MSVPPRAQDAELCRAAAVEMADPDVAAVACNPGGEAVCACQGGAAIICAGATATRCLDIEDYGRFNERLIELHEKVERWRPPPITAKP